MKDWFAREKNQLSSIMIVGREFAVPVLCTSMVARMDRGMLRLPASYTCAHSKMATRLLGNPGGGRHFRWSRILLLIEVHLIESYKPEDMFPSTLAVQWTVMLFLLKKKTRIRLLRQRLALGVELVLRRARIHLQCCLYLLRLPILHCC